LNIKITGRTEDVTAGMKKKAAEKVAKVTKYYDRITWVDVILGVEQDRKSVEVSAGLNRGTTIVGKAESDDMYTAIDLAVDKIARQIRRHKEKIKNHRPKRSEVPAEPLAEEDTEPTYEDVIEEMREG
jgi:ribosome hibernation promoting factor